MAHDEASTSQILRHCIGREPVTLSLRDPSWRSVRTTLQRRPDSPARMNHYCGDRSRGAHVRVRRKYCTAQRAGGAHAQARDQISGPGAERGVVFQKHALLPWLNVLDNVAFGLKLRGVARPERERLAMSFLELTELAEFAQHAIYHLSGGMQQRVGIARALTNNPKMLRLDEPLGALDALTRDRLQELILDIWQRTQKMMFFITYDVEEALFMATRLIIMSPRPVRITHEFTVDFGQRFLACCDARAIKSSPDFIALREQVLGIIHGDEVAA